MNKKNIGAILLKGAPKQRAKLLAEEIARATYNLETFLSDKDFLELQESFKTSAEIKLYNKYRKNSRVLVDSIANLLALKYEILMRYSDLRGWIVYWETIQQTELSINISLASIDNESKKYATAKEVALKTDYPFIQSTIDEENYISLLSKFDINTLINKEGKLTAVKNKDKIDKSNSLYSLLENIKTDTNKTLIRFLSWRRATLDFMEEEEFNIKTFKDVIEEITTEIRKPVINWPKYVPYEKTFILDTEFTRLDKLKEEYNITPDISTLKLDLEEVKTYRETVLTYKP
jgi:hypothetical protein